MVDIILPADHNFKSPQFNQIFIKRSQLLLKLRNDPILIPEIFAYYKNNIAQFIIDWGCTYDPRNPEVGLPSSIPFILFDKQIEWIDWLIEHWRGQRNGLVEKTRTVGMSWLSVATACSMCIFYDELSIGFGSRKMEYVDQRGSIDSLLEKARYFIENLPIEFRGGFCRNKTSKQMMISFPHSGSIIKGECGDNIGRGGRSSIYIVDESAFLERPNLIDASLSENTNCKIDVSTPNGAANPFAEKRKSGKIDVFTFHWKDDPRRDEEWYRKKCEQINNPVIIAQELNIDYNASKDYIVIQSAWIDAAIDSHKKLNIDVSGIKIAAVDISDTGKDKNAFCARYGILIEHIEEWTGNNIDTYLTAKYSFSLCDKLGYSELIFDGDGIGAGIRGDAREINLTRYGKNVINVMPFRGNGAVHSKEKINFLGRKNKDNFINAKSQSWWELRERFEKTYQAVTNGMKHDPDELISISSSLKELNNLRNELTQPTWQLNEVGKIKIDKTPDGVSSPNLADSVMMCFSKCLNKLNIRKQEFTLNS